MNEIQPIVTRIITAGGLLAVFVYFAVKFFIKPWISARYVDRWWHKLATNLAAFFLSLLITVAIFFLAFNDLSTIQLLVEALLVAFIAAASATYGHESIKNFGERRITNVAGDMVGGDVVGGDNIDVEDISQAHGIAIGEGSSTDSD